MADRTGRRSVGDSPTVRLLLPCNGKIPVLHVLANPGWYDGWPEMGKAWLAKNAPKSKVVAFG
jgi:hypothetical protein